MVEESDSGGDNGTIKTQIRSLCNSLIEASKRPGVRTFGDHTSQFRLTANGIRFHDLDLDELLFANLELMKVLTFGQLNTVVHYDHLCMWAWSTDIILNTRPPMFHEERHVEDALRGTVRALLSGAKPPGHTRTYLRLRAKADEVAEFHSQMLLKKTSAIATYLSFPLLEGVTKMVCSDYVSMDGTVLQQFSVPGRNYNEESGCYRLEDLLNLLHRHVAEEPLRGYLDDAFQHISQFGEGDTGPAVVGNWRNSMLHGEEDFTTIGGTITSLALLICVSQIPEPYADVRERILDRIKGFYNLPYTDRGPNEFYPPNPPE